MIFEQFNSNLFWKLFEDLVGRVTKARTRFEVVALPTVLVGAEEVFLLTD